MKIEAIHQYVYEVLPADGVGNCVLYPKTIAFAGRKNQKFTPIALIQVL